MKYTTDSGILAGRMGGLRQGAGSSQGCLCLLRLGLGRRLAASLASPAPVHDEHRFVIGARQVEQHRNSTRNGGNLAQSTPDWRIACCTSLQRQPAKGGWRATLSSPSPSTLCCMCQAEKNQRVILLGWNSSALGCGPLWEGDMKRGGGAEKQRWLGMASDSASQPSLVRSTPLGRSPVPHGLLAMHRGKSLPRALGGIISYRLCCSGLLRKS
ncbi:hypothetical protein B0T25DRAFT_80743 [Lasiosphaeria hispida]|uniref:Uncharacterized protein n=1 Tax=Lasiosphaeria hispida TaxID=260671 RepID=A0AAJ0HPS5_9PEZI|nr:hypothetical protein B0T25DRAFT_80743 [Lasiosphaeria hispida]